MTAATIGVAQGARALKFNIIDRNENGADGSSVSATVTTDFGAFMYYTGKNQVSACSGNGGATAAYAGFCESIVVSDMTGRRVDVFGELALVNVDKVAVWRQGKYFVTMVKGVVGDNVLIYPSVTAGFVTATQTGTDSAIGIAREGNAGVADGPIVLEIDLLGHRF